MIWDEHYECMSRDELERCQSSRLKQLVEYVYDNVSFYRKKMMQIGVEPGDICSIDDLGKLPFTTKQDLRDYYPYGMLAVPMQQIIRVHASSGTTGKKTVVSYTKRDVAIWSEVMARTLYGAGVSKDDIVQVAYGYGLFTGGLGVHYGCEKVGAAVVPISGGNTKQQIQIMKDFKTTVLACTPSYALYLAEAIEEYGFKRSDLNLKAGIFGAEPWTEEMRLEIEERLEIKAFDIYGLSEIIGPGVSFECDSKNGLHINEDHFLPEVIDPKTLQPLTRGQKGELVFTTLTKEAMPILRYRTRDLTVLDDMKCECGRTSVRMQKCIGRTDDMLIIRGVNIFPSQIERALLEMDETKPHYQLKIERINNLDILEVWVEVDESYFENDIDRKNILHNKIRHNIESMLGISIKVKLVEPKTIQRSEGKAKRVLDLRNIL